MEERIPLLKKLDLLIFKKLDEFKNTANYAQLVDFYSNLEEEQQKLMKWLLLISTAVIPLAFILFFLSQNSTLQDNLDKRVDLVHTMQQIISQNSEIGGLSGSISAPNAIESEAALQTRLSNVLSSAGVDLGKIRINNFSSENLSESLLRSEADYRFDGLSTEQLMTLFTALMQREKLKISSVNINRNNKSNLLDGTFHGIHFGQIAITEEDY